MHWFLTILNLIDFEGRKCFFDCRSEVESIVLAPRFSMFKSTLGAVAEQTPAVQRVPG